MRPSSWQAAARADGSANKENVGAVTPSPFSSRQRPSAAEVSDGPTWGGGWAASPGSASSVVNALALVPPAARGTRAAEVCANVSATKGAVGRSRAGRYAPGMCGAYKHLARRWWRREAAPRRARAAESAAGSGDVVQARPPLAQLGDGERPRVPPPRAGPTKPPPPRRRTAGGRPWTSRWRAAWRRVLVRGERSS